MTYTHGYSKTKTTSQIFHPDTFSWSCVQEKIRETNQQGVWGWRLTAIVLGQGQQFVVVPLAIKGFLAGGRSEVFIELGRCDVFNKGH